MGSWPLFPWGQHRKRQLLWCFLSLESQALSALSRKRPRNTQDPLLRMKRARSRVVQLEPSSLPASLIGVSAYIPSPCL